MQRYSIIMASLILLAPMQARAAEDNAGAPLSGEEIQRFFSQFGAVQLTYHVIDDTFGGKIGDEQNEHSESIAWAENILRKRATGELTPEEEAAWMGYSTAYLESVIETNRKFTEWEPRECVYIYSSMGERIRHDVIRIPHPEDNCVYIVRDQHLILLTTQGDFAGPTVDGLFPHNGATILGLHHLLNRRFVIDKEESAGNRLVLMDASANRMEIPHTFIMLDENPMFWKEFRWGPDDDYTRSIVCDEFVDVDGFLVPQVVKVISESRGEPELWMTLVDAKVNDANLFTEGFFEGEALPFDATKIARDTPIYLDR